MDRTCTCCTRLPGAPRHECLALVSHRQMQSQTCYPAPSIGKVQLAHALGNHLQINFFDGAATMETYAVKAAHDTVEEKTHEEYYQKINITRHKKRAFILNETHIYYQSRASEIKSRPNRKYNTPAMHILNFSRMRTAPTHSKQQKQNNRCLIRQYIKIIKK